MSPAPSHPFMSEHAPMWVSGTCVTCGADTSSPQNRHCKACALRPVTPLDPAWVEYARCAEVGPDAFFPGPNDNPRVAQRICAGCPVRDACLKYALDAGMDHGVWGGLTATQRRRLRKDGAA